MDACGRVSAVMLVALILAVLPLGTAVASDQALAAKDPTTLLVGFRPGTPPARRDWLVQSVGAVDLATVGAGTHKLKVAVGSVAEAVRVLKASPWVSYAEPNYLVRANLIPNDTNFGSQWGLRNTGQVVQGTAGTAAADINAVPAWNITTGSKGVVVGVVDTGIDYTHPELAPNIYTSATPIAGCPAGTHGYNALAGSCDPMDDNNHGTHVSGTIGAAGNDGNGVTGVNWNVTLMGLKALDSTGSGTTASVIAAIDFAVQAKGAGVNVRAINASWGGNPFSQALLDEINKAGANDILFVAAAGNNSANNDVTPTYPASYGAANELVVAATDQNDNLATFSNYGANSVDLGAPGTNILSTIRSASYAYASGTSMATPQVTGAAALILSAEPAWSTAQVRSAIIGTVDPVPALSGKTRSGGRLDVCKAIPGCAPLLGVSPGSMTMQASPGINPPPQNLTVQNAGAVAMTWTASTAAGSWLAVTPASGSLGPGAATTLTVAAASAALPAGQYSAAVVVSAGRANGSPASVPIALTVAVPGMPGYWLVASDGGIFTFRALGFFGSMGGRPLNQPVAGVARKLDDKGYWLVAADGGIFAFGSAAFYGSTGALRLNQPVVGMAATPTGKGYWLVAADGGIFTFGDAVFYGSTGTIRLNQPVVGMAAMPTGKGYWLAGADGGIFTFGDAGFYGSAGAIRLNQPVVGMAATPTGKGYWLVAADGGIFTFGDAGFYGSTGALRLNQPVVGMAATPTGKGYWLAAADGGIFTFGDAVFYGSTGAIRLNQPVVGMAAG